jgi:hypothetical protein
MDHGGFAYGYNAVLSLEVERADKYGKGAAIRASLYAQMHSSCYLSATIPLLKEIRRAAGAGCVAVERPDDSRAAACTQPKPPGH